MSAAAPPPAYKIGIVKQVISGDTIVIRRKPKGGPPPEKIIGLSGIVAPKLARQKTFNNDTESKDEPYAWEAREFLRKKLIGKEVIFTADKPPNSPREYGIVWAGKDPIKDENIVESLVALGLAKIREGSRNIPQMKTLVEIENVAKTQQKGVWGPDIQNHIRDINWNVEYSKEFINKFKGEPVSAIVEYVRDGSTVRLILLPEFHFVTMLLSGIRCPAIKQDGKSEPYAEEARFYVESRILQNDVHVILESVNNSNFVGTILHPQGNIAELLLRQGFAKCVDWSLTVMKSGANVLKAAEKQAKEERLRIWMNFDSNSNNISAQDKEYSATVVEVVNGDALVVKTSNGNTKKIFLASIRPPREKNNAQGEEGNNSPRPIGFKPLYDIPWLYEAREFLRKKVIGKRINVTTDYIQPAKDNFPEKICCTAICGGTNLAEALVSKGLATVVRYRNDNDQRSSHYDKLLEAEHKAQKAAIGLHAKKDIPTHRIQDTSGDTGKARRFFPFLKRARKTEATVEFVTSGSRMKLYIHKESVLITFLLAGINCPRGARPSTSAGPMQEAEPYGEEAHQFTKEKCFQRDVIVTIEDIDRAGSFIGWLWLDNENISVSLIERGLATMHHTAETSEYARAIKTGEENAKRNRIGLWKNYVEKQAEKKISLPLERVIDYQKIIVSAVGHEGHFFTQSVDMFAKLEALMGRIHVDFKNVPPSGLFVPKRGQLCAACFTMDKQWYRARIEKVFEDRKALVFYYDYGNKEVLDFSRIAPLPPGSEVDPPYAEEYSLVCVKFPRDEEERAEAVRVFSIEALDKKLLLNIETRGSPPAATLVDLTASGDIGKNLIKEGYVLMDYVREPRLVPLMNEYRLAQEHAKISRLNLWRHGDITDDDAIEFGARR